MFIKFPLSVSAAAVLVCLGATTAMAADAPPRADEAAADSLTPRQEAAPAPVDLASDPGPAAAHPPRAVPPPALASDMRALPGGGVRLAFSAGSGTPEPDDTAALKQIGASLAASLPQGRVEIIAQVANQSGGDFSTARRLSLQRALAVKEALVAGGLPGTRIDLRPLGRTEEGLDAADILPPAARAALNAQTGKAGGDSDEDVGPKPILPPAAFSAPVTSPSPAAPR